MSFLELFKLIGFATGAALHLYLSWLFLKQRGIRSTEKMLFWLGLVLGFWHLGNLIETVFDLLNVTSALTARRLSDTMAYAALSFLPPLTLHAQLRLWQGFDARVKPNYVKLRLVLCYLPLLVLPSSLALIWRGAYAAPIEKLAPYLLLFILWIAAVLWESAGINFYLARQISASREKHFFEAIALALLFMGALFALTYIIGARQWGMTGQYLEVFAKMSSLIPTALIAYYIYRYRYLELVIRQSFVYAIFALLVMVIYLYGIRRISAIIETGYAIRPGVIEAILILGLMLLAEPLRRITALNIQRLFSREVELYRDLVAQLGTEAEHYHSLKQFITYAEKRISESLALREVSITTETENPLYQHLFQFAERRQEREIEESELLISIDALACYALWREEKVIGLMIIRSLPQHLSADKREVLTVLSGQLASAIERASLLEEKVNLERELAERERLAVMGQMAATIAHEIKNPLSSIKSIAQVMREDENVSREYGHDLDLITGEINRLNQSVSQLLSFSRPAVIAATSTKLSEVINTVIALTRSECEGRNIKITADIKANPILDGSTVTALKEILTNLIINSAQAMPTRIDDGLIHLLCTEPLTISVTDNGLGIPLSLQQKIFEPFFTTKQRGTGLGLAIVARRVREIGGELSIVSPVKDERGTKFELKLK